MIGKRVLLNVLLKRGANVAEQSAGKLIRHGMTTVGGAIMTAGLGDGETVTALTGGLVALAGVVISFARIWLKDHMRA